MYWEWIFNRFYLVHKLSSGISIIMLNQYLLTSRLFSSDSFDQFFNLAIMTGIVAEDAITIALTNSLVYYNFINNTCLTLLQGEAYQCSPGQDPVVIALPDSHFLYCKDSTVGLGGPPETWALFNSQGGYISTQSSTDPDLLMSFFRKDTGMAPFKVHGVWYIACPQIALADSWLECSLVTPDSLHYYYFTSPNPTDDWMLNIYPYSDDRILRLYSHDPFGASSMNLFCNQSPLELHPDHIYSYAFGNHYPSIVSISDNITAMTIQTPDTMSILALWTLDFPIVHEFYFSVNNQFNLRTSFANHNTLYLVGTNKIYSYSVCESSPNIDEAQETATIELQVFPNPVCSGQLITISSQAKQPMVLDIFNMRGQKVRTLLTDRSGQITWNLLTRDGRKVSTGLYIIKLQDNVNTKPKKFLLLK